MKIFYSWQSDSKQDIGKNFIADCLNDAIAKLNASLEVTDATRPLELDQDTKGVTGDPVIADVILEKIDESDAIVVDVTLTGQTDAGKKLINSNVAYELGYAHKSISDSSVIKIMNTAFGGPSKLPFDLQHRRWPLKYNLSEGFSNDKISSEKEKLLKQLIPVLEAHYKSHQLKPIEDLSEPMTLQAHTTNRAEYWEDGEILASSISSQGKRDWIFDKSPKMYLRVSPSTQTNQIKISKFKNSMLNNCRPLGRHGSLWCERNQYGLTTLNVDVETGVIREVAQLFKNGEIWAVCSYMYSTDENGIKYIPSQAFEQIFREALPSYLSFRKNELGFSDQAKIEAGLVGYQDYHFAVSRNDFIRPYWGPIFNNEIVHEGIVDQTNKSMTDEFLLDFFEKVCDETGVSRPKNWYGFPNAS